MALLDGEPRSASATAARASELLRVGRASLEGLSRRHPESLEKLLREGIRVVSFRLRSANERYWGLAGRTLKAKADVAQTRSRLLSLVSHEFRTPLTIIKSSAFASSGRSSPRLRSWRKSWFRAAGSVSRRRSDRAFHADGLPSAS
jgi:CRP-like cAMP-binding protein